MFQVRSRYFLNFFTHFLNIRLFSRLSSPPITSTSVFGDSIAMTDSRGGLLACGKSQEGSETDHSCYEYSLGPGNPSSQPSAGEKAPGTWEKVRGMDFRLRQPAPLKYFMLEFPGCSVRGCRRISIFSWHNKFHCISFRSRKKQKRVLSVKVPGGTGTVKFNWWLIHTADGGNDM